MTPWDCIFIFSLKLHQVFSLLGPLSGHDLWLIFITFITHYLGLTMSEKPDPHTYNLYAHAKRSAVCVLSPALQK